MAPSPTRDGRAATWADVDPAWNCPVVPQGGVMAALAARAMAAELDDPDRRRCAPSPRCSPPRCPPARSRSTSTVLRRGRSMSQATATVRAEGPSRATTMAVFGRARGGFEFTDLAMPDVAAPRDCPSFRDPPPRGRTSLSEPRRRLLGARRGPARPSATPPGTTTCPTSSDCASGTASTSPPCGRRHARPAGRDRPVRPDAVVGGPAHGPRASPTGTRRAPTSPSTCSARPGPSGCSRTSRAGDARATRRSRWRRGTHRPVPRGPRLAGHVPRVPRGPPAGHAASRFDQR